MNSPTKPLAMVDLFAGCGGLSLGMEQAGFTPVFVNELNPDAMRSYLANRHHVLNGKPFPEHSNLRCHDANELQGTRLERLIDDLVDLEGFGLKFDGSMEGSLDLLTGGPPCQGFSGLGHRRSYSVDKSELPSNRLYVTMAKIIDRLQPKIFLFENVRGLLTSRWTTGGQLIWPDVLKEFRAISGYTVRWSLVHAKDYGVPQNRPRVLLVGIRNDLLAALPGLAPHADLEDAVKCGFLPEGEPDKCPDLIDLLGDLVDPKVGTALANDDLPKGRFQTTEYPSAPLTPIQKQLRAAPPSRMGIGNVGLTEQEYSRHASRIVSKFQHMLANGGEIPGWAQTRKFSQRLLPARWGNRSPHITATSMPDDYIHFSQPRTLTVREWARLQLFPDWYKFEGKRTTGGLRRAGNPREGIFEREAPKFTQIGNAVPVALAERVGKHFQGLLRMAEVSQPAVPYGSVLVKSRAG